MLIEFRFKNTVCRKPLKNRRIHAINNYGMLGKYLTLKMIGGKHYALF